MEIRARTRPPKATNRRETWHLLLYRQGKKTPKRQEGDRKCSVSWLPSPDGLDPLVALLGVGGGDAVGLMLPLHHLAVPVSLACLYLLAPAAGVV